VTDPERLETLYVRAAVTAWEAMAADGAPEDDRVNLAAYAAAVMPKLCDEVDALRATVQHEHRRANLLELRALRAEDEARKLRECAP
jgi:hypothetical protein